MSDKDKAINIILNRNPYIAKKKIIIFMSTNHKSRRILFLRHVEIVSIIDHTAKINMTDYIIENDNYKLLFVTPNVERLIGIDRNALLVDTHNVIPNQLCHRWKNI